MLIKYHDMFICAAEAIEDIRERFALTMIVNSDEKGPSADKLNELATEPYTELLLNHFITDDDLYNDSDQDRNIDSRLCNNNYGQNPDMKAIQSSIINISNNPHSGHATTNDDYSYKSRNISSERNYMHSLSDMPAAAIDTSVTKFIIHDPTITSSIIQIIDSNNSVQSTLTVNIHTISNTSQHQSKSKSLLHQ